MDVDDLSGVDRATLRLWRMSNLLGWGALGAVAGMATFFLLARTLLWFSTEPWVTGAVLATCVAVGAAVDGVIVGDHVYRAPGWVAAGSFLIPGAFALLVTATAYFVEVLIVMAVPVGGAVVAAIVARHRFRRRPRALRATSAR